MNFKKLDYERISENNMARASREFSSFIRTRRSVREFSNREIPLEVINNIVSAAASAPSGANKEPWFFSYISSGIGRPPDSLVYKIFYCFNWLCTHKGLGVNIDCGAIYC